MNGLPCANYPKPTKSQTQYLSITYRILPRLYDKCQQYGRTESMTVNVQICTKLTNTHWHFVQPFCTERYRFRTKCVEHTTKLS